MGSGERATGTLRSVRSRLPAVRNLEHLLKYLLKYLVRRALPRLLDCMKGPNIRSSSIPITYEDLGTGAATAGSVGKEGASRGSLLRAVMVIFLVFGALALGFWTGATLQRDSFRASGREPIELDGDQIAPVPADSALIRASRGEEKAIEKLSEKTPSERSLEEVVALSEGRVQAERDQAWASGILFASQDFDRVNSQQIQTILSVVGDPRTFREGLLSLAKIHHPIGADLIYQASRNYRHLPEVATMAEQLLATQVVRAQASPELTVVIDALSIQECAAAKELLEKTLSDGDSRAVRHLVRFAEREGCGPDGREDCYPCLRQGDLLKRALRAAQDRRAPHWM